MKNILIFTLLVFESLTGVYANGNYFGYARERGVIISVTPDHVPVKNGESVTFSGVIKVYNKGNNYKSFKNKFTLLKEFQDEGLDIVASFPSETTDVSNNLSLSSVNDSEIRFSYQTTQVNAEDLNQFSIKVYNNHQERELLERFSNAKAKLERRIMALNEIKNRSRHDHWSEKAVNYLDLQIQYLDQLIQKISDRLDSEEDLISENQYALQVDNLTANISQISTVMNKYRFLISTQPGSLIEGMKAKITASVTNLRKAGEKDDEDFFDDDRYKSAQFVFNNNTLYTSMAQELQGGDSISYTYTTERLTPADLNQFLISLYTADKKHNKLNCRIGWLSQSIPVLTDTIKPSWLSDSSPSSIDSTLYVQALDYVNLHASDEFGRIDSDSLSSDLSGSLVSGETYNKNVSLGFSKLQQGDGWDYIFSTDLNPLDEGLYKFESTVKDLAGNETVPYIVNFRIDRTPPIVNLQLTSSTLTNKTTSDISVLVTDLSPLKTDVYVNNVLAFSTNQNSFPATVNLPIEGTNTIKVISTDMAGNISTAKTVDVVRDTTPADLTISAPQENDYVNGVQFGISGSSNEALSNIKVNGSPLQLGSDKLTFAGVFTSLKEGSLTLELESTDLAGNVGHKLVTVNVRLKALNPELLSLFFDAQKNKLLVKGAAGATRPGVTVHASGSLFNSNDAVGGADGSFVIELDPCTDVEVSAYDPLIDKKEVAELHFGSSDGIILSGTIRDTNDIPLPNAKVSLVGSSVSVLTNANGIFSFTQDMFGNKSIYGDQNLLIDGRSISQGTGENVRKFSIVQVAITISLNEKNVLQRPIYLAPVVIDGTETLVSGDSAATVTSPHAPGVELDIPADSVQFPDGSSEAAISMQEINASMATIPTLAEAAPKSVVALEPSGTVFSKPVTLTLPNKNDFPPNMEMVILLMNSKTGKWEVGGSAVVSDNGSSIVTKPDQGIRHFSLAYAAPVGPTVRQIGAQDKPGADTFNGAATAQIDLPSFKSLGNTVSPSLTYKSSWAKPTALVTNLFDMSTRKVDVTIPEQSGSLVDKVKVNLPYCSLKVPFLTKPDPGDIKCYDNFEEYMYDIQYKISYKNTQSVLTPDKIVASFQTENLKTPEDDPSLTFTGLPDMAAISYAMELKDPNTQNYFSSGIHPYTAHYDLHFKEMVVGTRVVEQKINQGEPQLSEESFTSDTINKVFPQDLTESLYVQNYVNSEAGRGWRVNGAQKIVNTSGDKVMIEEANGDIATYSLANTIDTLKDLNGTADLSKGVGLNKWPYLQYTNSADNSYQQVDLSNGSVSTISTPVPMTGEIAGYDYYNYTYVDIIPQWECVHHNWLNACDEYGYKYYYNYYPTSSCSRHKYQYSISSQPSQFLMAPNGDVYGLDYGRSNLFISQSGSSRIVGGSLAQAPNFANYYQYQKDDNNQQITNYCNATLGMNCTPIQTEVYILVNQPSSCGSPLNSSGYIPDTAALNNPMGMAVGLEPNTMVIADSGHHQVKLVNTATGQSTVIAGTGRVADSTTPGPAASHDIFYPRGVAYDHNGNLYISSKGGYIRKLDQLGNIQIIAGDPINGQIIDSGDAREMKLVEPYGLVVDNARNFLYVADTGQNRVIRIDLSSLEAKTVAGNRSSGFSGDGGAALDASLNSPSHLGLDPDGNLLIADAGNNRIRRVVFQSSQLGTLAFAPTNEDNSKLYRNADGIWTRIYRNGNKVYFDNLGRQYSATDLNGRTTEFLYDSSNRLTQVKDPVGQIIHYNYSGAHLSSITDPAGRETDFSYNFNGDLASVTYPDGSNKKFEYDSGGLLTSEKNEKGAEVKYVYNAQNRIEKIIKPDETDIKISDSGSTTTGGGELQSQENTKNSVTDSNGNTTELAKDFSGYISTITDAKGRVTKIKRDLKGRPIEITDVDGTVTQNTYDPVYGDVIKTVNVTLDSTTETQYNVYGQVVSQTDPYGKVTQKQYDSKNQLVKEVSPDGKYLTYEYNSLGLISKKSFYNASDELQNQISYDYDNKAQLIKQTSLDGKFSTYTYDLAGNVLSSTLNIDSSSQSTTQYEYDSMSRLIKVISPRAEVTEYGYSPVGELTQIKDPNNKVTSFEYNTNGQLVKKTNSLGQTYQMTYDANGNMLTETDPTQQIKQYFYNEVNKLTKVQTADDLIQYQYNVKDEVVQIANSASTISYTRDAKQRIIQEDVVGIGYPEHLIQYTYSKNDLRTSLQSNDQNITYNYNPDNYQLLSMSSSATGNYAFSYDEANRLNLVTRPGSTTSFSFDTGSNLVRISHKKGSTEIGYHEYSYDLRNFITQNRSPASTLDYSYDPNGQLVSANKTEDSSQNETFSYDALGNRLTYNGVQSTYDNTGQRIQDDGQYTYVYDLNGNITYKQNKTNGISYAFEYSALNQLKKATVTSTPLNGNILKTIEYKYDPAGRRIMRQLTDYQDSSKSKTQKYYYDGDNIIAELDNSDNLTASYTHSPLRSDDILGAKFTTAAVNQGIAASSGYAYYLKDHLNTITDIVNANGDTIQSMQYSAFGVLRSVKDSTGQDVSFNNAPVRTSFTYTGREYEPELGLYYYRARYYDPNTGRFLQQDPDPGKLSNPNTFLSKYIYAGNAPTMFGDPSGRFLELLIGALIGAFVGAVVGATDGLVNGGNFLEKVLKGAVGGALFGAAIALNPFVGGLALGVSVIKAGATTGNFFENFNRNIVADGALALVGSAISTSVDGITDVNKYVPLYNPILDASYYSNFFLIPKTVIDTINVGCNRGTGAWSGSDLCRL